MAGKRSRKDVKNTRQKRLENIVEDKELGSLASTSKVMSTQDYCTKPSSHSRKRFPLDPDISSILKEDDTVQDDNHSCYEHPLHSTAVSIAESSEDSEEQNVNEDKNTKTQDRSHTSEASEEKKKKSQSSENITSDPNIVRSFPEEAVLQTQKGKKRKKSPQVIEPESSEAEGCSSTKASHPEHLHYSSKRLTGLEVILREFEKIASEYRDTMGLDVCNNAIEKFTIHFKEQLTETVSQVHDLKNLKKKNRQVIAAISEKSKELLELKGEQLKMEPKLKALQKKYAELQEKSANMKNMTQFLNDLKDLQAKYTKYLEKNPKEEEVYGAASMPAMLFDARGVLGAESHLRTVNTRLNNQLKQTSK